MKNDHFACHIELCNTTFDDAPMSELARILRKLADDLESGEEELTLDRNPVQDVNGDRIGHFSGTWER